MIYVNGELLLGPSHSTDALHNIVSLLANQDLLKFSKAFRTKQVQTITYASSSSTAQFAEGRIGVYIMQKEFAFVDPSKVDFVGTDTAIASIGVIIRNRRTGMITIAHFDSFASVDQGFDQIIESMSADYQTDDKMDVYLIGAVDYPPDVNNPPEIDLPLNLCAMIVETLKKRRENFHMQLFQVLKNNTLLYADYGKPIFHGFKMETSNGTVLPARFDASSRIPAEDLRRARNIVINKMTTTQLNQHLHRVYHDEDDTFVFDPFSWNQSLHDNVFTLVTLFPLAPEKLMLSKISKTPKAEPPDFEDYMIRGYEFIVKNHPSEDNAFPDDEAHVYKRCGNGNSWTLMEE